VITSALEHDVTVRLLAGHCAPFISRSYHTLSSFVCLFPLC